MTRHTTPQALSLALALVMTLGMLGGVGALAAAASDTGSVSPTLAQQAAPAPHA